MPRYCIEKKEIDVAKSRIERGQIIFRQWQDTEGLSETTENFTTLEELFHLCIEARDPLLVDRVTIQGYDVEGNSRELTLVFQSIAVSEGKD